MFNRNEMRLAKKVVQVIVKNTTAVRFNLDGVIQDVDSGMWTDAEVLIPLIGKEGTVGAVRARPNWKTDPLIIDHLIASVQGRMMHFSLIEHAKVNPADASPEQMAALLSATDQQQRKILVSICGAEKAEAHWKTQNEEMDKIMKEIMPQSGSVKF